MRKLHRELNGLKPRSSRMTQILDKTAMRPGPKLKSAGEERDRQESEASSSGSEDGDAKPIKRRSKSQDTHIGSRALSYQACNHPYNFLFKFINREGKRIKFTWCTGFISGVSPDIRKPSRPPSPSLTNSGGGVKVKKQAPEAVTTSKKPPLDKASSNLCQDYASNS